MPAFWDLSSRRQPCRLLREENSGGCKRGRGVRWSTPRPLGHSRTPEDVLADFQTFCKRIHAKLPDTRIVYLSIHVPPARIKQADKIAKANALIAAECGKNKKLAYIDISSLMLGDNGQPNRELYADSLHPNAKAYELWAAKLRPALK
jgi:lysophospholipase L1-like esterase